MNIRTVLLLGKTGGGKSTLANVLINRNRNFEEVFSESAGMTSETRQNQVEEFTVNITEDGNERIRFIIVDTVGLCDTRMTEIGVLQRISEMSNQIRDGLNQILFVTGGRFTREEIKSYNLLSQILFDIRVANYTTIVHKFEDEGACERDRQNLRSENRELFNIIRNARIMYVDNPPINLSGGGTRIARQNALNKEIREESRRRLLARLANCRAVYKPENLDSLNDRVNNYKTEEEKMQARVAELQQRITNQAANHQAQINAMETKYQKDLRDLEDKMKKDLANELAEKEKRFKAISDEAQKKADELQKRLDKEHKKGSDSISNAFAQLAISNQSTSRQLEKFEEEKEKNKKEQEKILGIEKEIIGMKIWAHEQEVRNQERERYDNKLAEVKGELAEVKKKAEEPKTQVIQSGLLNSYIQINANIHPDVINKK